MNTPTWKVVLLLGLLVGGDAFADPAAPEITAPPAADAVLEDSIRTGEKPGDSRGKPAHRKVPDEN